jgi:hypothetical protein
MTIKQFITPSQLQVILKEMYPKVYVNAETTWMEETANRINRQIEKNAIEMLEMPEGCRIGHNHPSLPIKIEPGRIVEG